MIQIAIISDIHANLPALKEVMKDIHNRSIDQVYCLGDLVDFAPWNNEVIEYIKEYKIPCLLGNHDERIAFDLPIIPLPHHDEVETANRFLAITYTKKEIHPENKKWLSYLPYTIELQYKIGHSFKKILLVHASISSNDEYVYREDINDEMIKSLQEQNIDAIVMGHTHTSYVQKYDNLVLINAGSVGRSRERDRMATYSILTLHEEGIDSEIIKINYPIEEVASAIYKSEIPDFYGNFLLSK